MAGAVMRGVVRRAALAAGAAVVVAGSVAGAAAKPRPPVLAFTPSPYSYGHVAAGRGAASQTFTLANSGGRATGKLRVRVDGAAAFTITGDTCKTLGPGKKCTVTVRFAPASAGTVTATLTAAGKKPAATATMALTGTGALGAAPGHLYWTNSSDGTINESNLNGSSPRVLVSGQTGAEGLAVNASHLYWANFGNATIDEANLDGSNPHVIATGMLSHGVAVAPSASTGPPSVRARSMRPTWTAATPRPSSPARATHGGWKPTVAGCTGPTPTPKRSTRPP